MNIALFGHGKMGKMVEKLAIAQGNFIVEPTLADVCIDFSHATAVFDHANWAAAHQKPLIIGTTGWEENIPAVQALVEKSGIAVLYSPNFSLGMACFIKLLEQAKALFIDYDIAGVEYHHNQKKDSPSGTAKALALSLEMNTPFTSVRCGRIAGKHEVIFDSPFDSIILTHEVHSREGFAEGALKAAKWIQNRKGWYTIHDMLRSLYRFNHSL